MILSINRKPLSQRVGDQGISEVLPALRNLALFWQLMREHGSVVMHRQLRYLLAVGESQEEQESGGMANRERRIVALPRKEAGSIISSAIKSMRVKGVKQQ
jgi:hypothetical protein